MPPRRTQKTTVIGDGALQTRYPLEGTSFIIFGSAQLSTVFLLVSETQVKRRRKGKGKATAVEDVAVAVERLEDPSVSDLPAPESSAASHSRQRRSSSKVRDTDNAASAMAILYPDSPVRRPRRRRQPRSTSRDRHITFAEPDSPLSSPSRHSTAPPSTAPPSTAPPSPVSSSGSLPPTSRSSDRSESPRRTPSPQPTQGDRDRGRAPAGNKRHHSATDVWTFYEEIDSRKHCKFCRYACTNIIHFQGN